MTLPCENHGFGRTGGTLIAPYPRLLHTAIDTTDGEVDDADWLVLVDPSGARTLAFQQASRDDLQRERERSESLGAQLLLNQTDDSDEPLYVFAGASGHPF